MTPKGDEERPESRVGPDGADADPGGDRGPGPDGGSSGGGRASKAEVAAGEKGERVYTETYGRPAGDRFRSGDYRHAYGSPGGVDWRRALRAYVAGHDRGWEADRKYAAAGRAADEADARRTEDEPTPTGDAGTAGEASARTERGTRFGIAVAEPGEMTFHRSASTWRERLPRAPRMPRHAGRDLDGRRGRGEQA